MRVVSAAASLATVIALSACGSTSPKATAPTASTTTLPAVITVGPNPSVSSRMVCATEGQAAIEAALNEKPTTPPTALWADHVYSCRYTYPQGELKLAVKELTRASETTSYFNALKRQLGTKEALQLGQGGFIAPNGEAVVRKDYKVLVVDPRDLPPTFGKPLASRFVVAGNLAIALMGCWTGA